METTNPKPGIGSPGAGKERTDARSLGDVLCVEPKGGTLSLHYGYTASIFSELYSILEIHSKRSPLLPVQHPSLWGERDVLVSAQLRYSFNLDQQMLIEHSLGSIVAGLGVE
jgi:hypothetical protein